MDYQSFGASAVGVIGTLAVTGMAIKGTQSILKSTFPKTRGKKYKGSIW